MSRFAGPLSVIGIVILAILFAAQNGMERVTLDLGLFVLYGVPVTIVAFGGFFLGMLVILGAGFQADLKVRSILRQRLAEETTAEIELGDHAQRDLFLHAPPAPTETSEPGRALDPWEVPIGEAATSDAAAVIDESTSSVDPTSTDASASTPQPITREDLEWPEHLVPPADVIPDHGVAAGGDLASGQRQAPSDELTPNPEPAPAVDESLQPGSHPSWRDMEHGDPMD